MQSCTAKVNTIHRRLQEGQQDRQEFNVTETIEADYQWTADGLESAVLNKGVRAIIGVRVGGGAGGGGVATPLPTAPATGNAMIPTASPPAAALQ